MKRFLLKTAACWWPALASAVPLPSQSLSISSLDLEDDTVYFQRSGDEATIRFQTPCRGCVADADENLLFDFSVTNSGELCQSSKVLLNGHQLSQTWDGLNGWDNGFIDTIPTNAQGHQTLEASWQSSCINTTTLDHEHAATAQVISFIIHRIGQDTTDSPSGFTLSFRPRHKDSEYLRLAREPLEISHDSQFIKQWADPNLGERVKLVESSLKFPSLAEELRKELQDLERLQSQEIEIQDSIRQKFAHIHELADGQCKLPRRRCHGIRCALQGVLQRIPELVHRISAELRGTAPTRTQCMEIASLSAPRKHARPAKFFGTPPIFPHDEPLEGVEASTSSHRRPLRPVRPLQEDPKVPMIPPVPVIPPVRPLAPVPPISPSSPIPPIHPASREHYDQAHRHHRPHAHQHPHDLRHDVRNILFIVLGVIVCGSIFRAFRTGCFADPRRRAERLARREERHNRRMYRRAAARLRWKQFWERGFFRHQTPRICNYDEKRAIVLEQEGVLEDAMQGEIKTLRLAHEIAGDMVSAEEGRARLYHRANLPRYAMAVSPSSGATGAESSRWASSARTQSLSGYRSETGSEGPPPPRYEEELGADLVVVDGFQYTPSSSTQEDDGTPDSSVIDCNTRVSVDTGDTDDQD